MNVKRWVWVALVSFVGAGCAANVRPGAHAYPLKGQSAEQQENDRAVCEAWAKEQSGFDPVTDTTTGVAVGAVLGALLGAAAGAAIGAAAGNVGKGAAMGAAVGGVGGAGVGGTHGASKNREGFDRAYSLCIVARGYSTEAGPPPPGMVELTVSARPAQVRRGETVELETAYRVHAPAGSVTVRESRTVTFNGSVLSSYPRVGEWVRSDGPHVTFYPQRIPAVAEPGTYRYEGLVCVAEQCISRAASFQVLP